MLLLGVYPKDSKSTYHRQGLLWHYSQMLKCGINLGAQQEKIDKDTWHKTNCFFKTIKNEEH